MIAVTDFVSRPWKFEQVFDKNSAQCTVQLPELCGSKNAKCLAIRRPHTEGLGIHLTCVFHIENIKVPAIPYEATNYRYISRLILQVHNYSPYNVLFLLRLFLRVVTANCSIYEPFQETPVLVCEIDMIEFTANASVVELYCRNLTFIVYFRRICNIYVRMTIYSSLSSFLYNELLSNKSETPDVNFNTQGVSLDVQLPF